MMRISSEGCILAVSFVLGTSIINPIHNALPTNTVNASADLIRLGHVEAELFVVLLRQPLNHVHGARSQSLSNGVEEHCRKRTTSDLEKCTL